MRFLPTTSVADPRATTYSVRRRATIDFESCGGEPHFEHDLDARPLARIYQFPVTAVSRSAARAQRKARA
jgi:hypothetical protein